MSDTRPRVTTTKSLDLGALDDVLGDHGLCMGDGVIVVAEGSPVTQQQLEDAVAAASEFVPPPDPDDELDAGLAEVAARDDVPAWGQELLAQLRGQGGHAGRAAGRRPE